MEITIKHTISDEMMVTLFSDMNSGSGYWAAIVEDYPSGYKPNSGLCYEDKLWEWVKEGGTFTVEDVEDEETKFVIGLKEIKKGLEVMAQIMTTDFSNLINEEDDATTGDVFLQCCCFPEEVLKNKDVIYG